MSSAKERLLHLVSQATGGQTARAFLVGELADLLLDWPADCPDSMRPPVLALFERLVREIGQESRAQLATRFSAHSELPLELLNEFYLAAPAEMRREILKRNDAEGEDAPVDGPGDLTGLMATARDERAHDFPARAAHEFRVARDIAGAVFADPTGEALAVLCKGMGYGRAAFSALAILRLKGSRGIDARLSAYDGVPQHAAERLTHHWQTHCPSVPKAAE